MALTSAEPSPACPSPWTDVDYGVMVVGRGGLIKHANERARRWLRDFFGAERTTRLPERLGGWITLRQRRCVAGDHGRPRGGAFAVERNGRRLLVRVVPDGTRRLLLLEEEKPLLAAADLDSLRLTRREAEVLPWVAAGKTNQEVAVILGISPRTVKKHLEHIYSKLGVETRTAAAAVALSFVSSLPARHWPDEHPDAGRRTATGVSTTREARLTPTMSRFVAGEDHS